jgi:hypothetical protein
VTTTTTTSSSTFVVFKLYYPCSDSFIKNSMYVLTRSYLINQCAVCVQAASSSLECVTLSCVCIIFVLVVVVVIVPVQLE